MATLLIQLPSGAKHFHQLPRRDVLLGRSRDADIQVVAKGVSRVHARLKPAWQGTTNPGMPERYYLEDLHSKNGVFLNEQRVKRMLLANGDCVTLGQAKLYFFNIAPHVRAEASINPKSEPPAMKRSEGSPGQPLRWVISKSKILSGRGGSDLQPGETPQDAAAQLGDTSPALKPRGDKGDLGAMSRRTELLELRAEVFEKIGTTRSPSQLFEQGANIIAQEFPVCRVSFLVSEDGAENYQPIFLKEVQLTDPTGEAVKNTNEATVFLSAEAIAEVRREMCPIAFRLTSEHGSDSLVETSIPTSGISVLAPLLGDKGWLGAIQADWPSGSTEVPEETIQRFGEVADVISRSLRRFSQENLLTPESLGDILDEKFFESDMLGAQSAGALKRLEWERTEGVVIAFYPTRSDREGESSADEKASLLHHLSYILSGFAQLNDAVAPTIAGSACILFVPSSPNFTSQEALARHAISIAIDALFSVMESAWRSAGGKAVPMAVAACLSLEEATVSVPPGDKKQSRGVDRFFYLPSSAKLACIAEKLSPNQISWLGNSDFLKKSLDGDFDMTIDAETDLRFDLLECRDLINISWLGRSPQ